MSLRFFVSKKGGGEKIMLHRGKKCFAELRILKKRSLIDDRDIAPQRRKGGGSWRTKVKPSGEYHSDYDSGEPARLIAEAEFLMRQASYCKRYSPETAGLLITHADELKRKAAGLQEWERRDTIKRRRRNLQNFWAVRYGRSYWKRGCVSGPSRYFAQFFETKYAWTTHKDSWVMANINDPNERYYKKYLQRQETYHYHETIYWREQTIGWSWCNWQPQKREAPHAMHKAQYTAYHVPQEYPSASYEILMPVETLYEEYERSWQIIHPVIIERITSDRPVMPYDEFSRAVEKGTREENHMAGISYSMVNPLSTLKLISAGSIFGEPMYYHEGDNEAPVNFDSIYGLGWEDDYRMSYYDDPYDDDPLPYAEHFRKMSEDFRRLTASQVMERVIDDALSYSFEGTLKWAIELREKFLVRLNPQVIIVRASVHPNRKDFTRRNPGKFQEYAQKVMTRGDDVIHQFEYWLATHGTKSGIPPILKRSWAENIGSMDSYSMSKYANAGTGLINTVRVCHAKGPLVDTLMREGRVPMPEGQNTWERLRASGMSWKEILETIRLPHMALLRNLRGIFSEVEDPATLSNALDLLKRGVKGGKQFPFRYYTAWKIFEDDKESWLWDAIERLFPWHNKVQKALEDCINISCANLPELPGRCAFLTDNSGSAWGTHTSEHGSISMAEIGNLSSVIGAVRSEKGIVFTFGDTLRAIHTDPKAGVLEQARLVNSIGRECGMLTESGLYAFFRDAVCQKQHWDNIFIYSDMQAGSSRKFGINPRCFRKMGAYISSDRIDINEIVKEYRRKVNPKLNVVCIQTSGYTNSVMPEYGYRSSILCGWSGKELVFADAVRRLWDEIESSGRTYILDVDSEKVNLCGF